MESERTKPHWWETRSPVRSFVLAAVFVGVIVVVSVLEPSLRQDPLRLFGLVTVATVAAAAQCASAIATIVYRRRLNAERPDS